MIGLDHEPTRKSAWMSRSRPWHMIEEIDLVRFIAGQSAWLRLCADLECMADRLPDRAPREETAAISAELGRLVGDLHDGFPRQIEELLGESATTPLARSLIDHVAARDAARTVHAYDLIEALVPPPTSTSQVDAETLGYMLRCFFEGVRQTVALERLSLFELGGDRLTAGARILLTDRIIECCEAG